MMTLFIYIVSDEVHSTAYGSTQVSLTELFTIMNNYRTEYNRSFIIKI